MATFNCCLPCTWKHCLGYLGAILALLGIMIAVLQPTLITAGLKASLSVVPETLYYEQFIKPEPPIYLKVYIWNVTNPEDFIVTSTGIGPNKEVKWTFPKPVVEQVGPFVFREFWLKNEITFMDAKGYNISYDSDNKDKSRIRGRQMYKYKSVYDPRNEEEFGLDPYDPKYTVNVASILAVGLPNIVDFVLQDTPKTEQATIRGLVENILESTEANPIVKDVTPFEALFGYEDDLLAGIQDICESSFLCKNSDLYDVIMSLPTEFGILVQKNTPLGWNYFEWDTGMENIHDYAQITKFGGANGDKYITELDWWPEGSDCNLLKGTDGVSMPTNLKKGEDIWAFSADLFRSFYVGYTNEVKSANYDIPTYHYDVQPVLFAAPNDNPENSCYCYGNFWWDNKNTEVDCHEISGGIIGDAASLGIPILLSLPHFLWGDKLREIAYGNFNPNPEEHNTYLEYEPVTGTAILAEKRIQQSLVAVKDNNWGMFKDIDLANRTVIMPLVWVVEASAISEELEKELYTSSVLLLNILLGVYISLIVLGVLLVAFSYWKVRKI